MENLKKTALHGEHLKLNAKMVEFGGWHMPVQYKGLAAEHEACRTKVGLFDVSHMGEIRVQGKHALDFLNKIVTNNVSLLKDGQAQYTAMCYENGGCVDDLIIHRMGEEDYFICANASNTEKDFAWIKEHAPKDVKVLNQSAEYSQIAIQGRYAEQILQKLTKANLANIKYYWFTEDKVLGIPSIIARTGYTGEAGFEIYVPWNDGPKIWSALLEEGASFGIQACGLGARDTLRTEMKMSLYGHEIDQDTDHNPIEAGLGWVVKWNKGDFIGRSSLEKIKQNPKKTLVGLKSLGREIPRQGYAVEVDGKTIGIVTSGTMSPSLKVGIAIAAVELPYSKVGTRLNVSIRGQTVAHEVVETPFYKRPY